MANPETRRPFDWKQAILWNLASVAIVTIAAPNYLPFIRVLMDSACHWAPDARRFAILAGRLESLFDSAAEDFEILLSESLPLPESKWFHFKYTVLELCTALKPYVIQFLLDRFGFDEVLYFDPDIRIYGLLDSLRSMLPKHSFILTPHLTNPISDGLRPNELEILRAGAYNGGFIAVRDCQESRVFLNWWQARVYDHCFIDQPSGLFVDQRWLDLAPGLFPDAAILRDPGYNVAYWNLAHRRIARSDDDERRLLVNGEPLYFFHFSGFDPERPGAISCHQNRYRLENLDEAARSLFLDYAKAVLTRGYEDCKDLPYAFGHFVNGTRVPDSVRNVYFHDPELARSIQDPFSEEGCRKLIDFWKQPSTSSTRRRLTELGYSGRNPTAGKWEGVDWTGLSLPKIAQAIYESRPDVQAAYPDPNNKDRVRFLLWLLTFGAAEYSLEAAFLEPIQQEWESSISRLHNPVAKLRDRAQLWAMSWRTNTRRARAADPKPAPSPQNDGAPEQKTGMGINFFGYVRSEMGVGESGRCAIRAAKAAAIPLRIRTVDEPGPYRLLDQSIKIQDATTRSDGFPYSFNLFNINADQATTVMLKLAPQARAGKFNIGYWVWELEEFPSRWLSSFNYFNEIWTPSRFCAEAFSRKSPIPVLRMPYAIEMDPPPQLSRSAFGLPEKKFLFLFVFDLMSVFERKNPLAVIAAFREAFRNSGNCHLVLKINYGAARPAEVERIAHTAEGLPVTILNRTMDRADVNSLVQCCDCLISLHRSEGYGLTLAEAMYLGKPVIATAYSGNLDFTKPDNSFLVRYRMTAVPAGCEPYDEGLSWADPCLSHAVELMKTVVDFPEIRTGRALAGQAFIRTHLSHAAVGAMMKKRLKILQSWGPPLKPPGFVA